MKKSIFFCFIFPCFLFTPTLLWAQYYEMGEVEVDTMSEFRDRLALSQKFFHHTLGEVDTVHTNGDSLSFIYSTTMIGLHWDKGDTTFVSLITPDNFASGSITYVGEGYSQLSLYFETSKSEVLNQIDIFLEFVGCTVPITMKKEKRQF